eukprot:9172474-Alexandrium_andersonii.AAC.1
MWTLFSSGTLRSRWWVVARFHNRSPPELRAWALALPGHPQLSRLALSGDAASGLQEGGNSSAHSQGEG